VHGVGWGGVGWGGGWGGVILCDAVGVVTTDKPRRARGTNSQRSSATRQHRAANYSRRPATISAQQCHSYRDQGRI